MGGLSGPTAAATITVAFAGPKVTNATTTEGAQTTSGLVVTPAAADSTAGFFRVTAIVGGTLANTLSAFGTASAGEGNPAAVFVEDRSRRGWAMVEARLGEAPFFGGANLTTADIMMVYCLTTGRAFRGTSLDAFPNLKAYLQRIGQRPAYQRAMAKAEPGMAPMLS